MFFFKDDLDDDDGTLEETFVKEYSEFVNFNDGQNDGNMDMSGSSSYHPEITYDHPDLS